MPAPCLVRLTAPPMALPVKVNVLLTLLTIMLLGETTVVTNTFVAVAVSSKRVASPSK